MKNNKRLLLVLAVMGTVFAVTTAVAMASVWKDKNGTNVTKLTEFSLKGGELFETESGANGMSCEVSATLTTEGGSTGKITAWTVSNCGTGFGKLSGCTVSSTETIGKPWTVDVNTSDLTITSMHIKRKFSAGCAITEIDKTISPTVTLDIQKEMSNLEFSGETTGYKAFGSLKVETNAGTYGIG